MKMHSYYKLGPDLYKAKCEEQFAVIDNLPKQDRALIREFGNYIYQQAKRKRLKKLSSIVDFCYDERIRHHKLHHPGLYPEPELLAVDI